MNEERCILCNRAYEYDRYKLFGRGCLSNLYNLLSISNPPRGTKDKEMYLCNKIAHRNFKFFLSKKKKYKLAEKYVALKYLDKINFNKYSNVEIMDTYDYTDFKSLREYVTSNDSVLKSIVSVTLNNFAVASYEYGVIKPYHFTIKFEMNNHKVSEVDR